MQSQAIGLTSSHWMHDGVWITVFKNEKAVEILCIFSDLMQSQAFSGILWADSSMGQVANTLWRVWVRPSVAQPHHPCRHRLSEKHSFARALGLQQGWSMSVTPLCVYSTPFFVPHIHKIPWIGQLKGVMLRKYLFLPTSYQCHSLIPETWILHFYIKMEKFTLFTVVS